MRIDRWLGPLTVGGLLIALMTAPAATGQDQGPGPSRLDTSDRLQPREVAFTARVEPTRVMPGETVTYAVTAKVRTPWHIYAHAEEQPQGVAAVPTRIELFRTGGLEPSGEGWTASETPIKAQPLGGVIAFDYHEDTVTWTRQLRVPDDAEPGTVALQSQLTFQLCTESTCKPPARRTVEPVDLTIVARPPQANADRPTDPIAPALAAIASPMLVPPQDAAGPQPERRDSPPILQPKEATFSTGIEPAEARPGETINYKVSVKLAPTWHIYAYAETIPEGVAAVPTRFDLFGLDGLEPAGEWAASREPHEPKEVSGVLTYKYYEDEVTWTLPLKVPTDAAPGERSVRTQIQFQICDPKMCKPLTRVTLPAVAVTVLASDGAAPAAHASGVGETAFRAPNPAESASAPAAGATAAPARSAEPPETADEQAVSPGSSAAESAQPAIDGPSRAETSAAIDPPAEVAPAGDAVASTELQGKIDQGLLPFMGWSALGGLVALLMPCVWPMVPITVNFFVKQGQQGKKSTTGLAVTYCLAIIGVFTMVGVLFSAFFGAASLSQLANAAWLNILVAGLFIAFGLSLLGVFEIRLPSFLLNASAQGESRGGFVGVIFMALTLTITSFTCTFPVVGALLVLAAGGSYLYPVIGLATFATVLALPFFLLALAPGTLQRLPRSGDWMNAVKVVGGLVEIGAAFKFINTAEISLGANPEDAWFDSQVLMAAWVIIAAVCGLYLLGIIKTSHDHGEGHIGAGRLLFGTMFLGLALYFAPALFGYPPRSNLYDRLIVGLLPADADEMDSLVQLQKRGLSGAGPAGGGGGAALADADETDPVRRARNFHGVWWGLSYDAALEQAKASNKPVLIDFTGVNCANCRQMEMSVLPRPEVVERLGRFVPVQLYTDRVPVDGLSPDEKFDLAEQNLLFEVELTRQQVSPLYVVLNPDGRVVVPPKGGYIEPSEFVSYLDRALAEYGEVARTARTGE